MIDIEATETTLTNGEIQRLIESARYKLRQAIENLQYSEVDSGMSRLEGAAQQIAEAIAAVKARGDL